MAKKTKKMEEEKAVKKPAKKKTPQPEIPTETKAPEPETPAEEPQAATPEPEPTLPETKEEVEATPSPRAEGEKKETGKLIQLVIFSLGGEEYGVEISEVQEIVKKVDVTNVPNAPQFIEGIINLRGKIVVVIDLEKRFRLEREKEQPGEHIIIAEMGGGTYGLMVDEVSEVLRVPEENIKAAPEIISAKIHAEYLKGVATIEERLIILLDLTKVLAEEELAKLSQEMGKHIRKIKPKVTEKKHTEESKEEVWKEAEKEKELREKGESMAKVIEAK